MASKPLVVGQQRNGKLAGPASAAGLPAIVNSDGRIVNASGFSGYVVNGGPEVSNVPVLSSPSTPTITLSADQCVGGEIHMSAGGNTTLNLPSAAQLLQYLTTANCRSDVRSLTASSINLATLPLGPSNTILQPSVMVPVFKTKCFLGGGASLNVNAGAGCGFKTYDLSVNASIGNFVLANETLYAQRYTLYFYVVNIGGQAAPNDQPQIAIIPLLTGSRGFVAD